MTEQSANQPRRILYVCHDGDLFGSQQSLAQMIEHLPDGYEAVLTVAKPGPLEERLKNGATIYHHKRLGWFKHSPRNMFQRLGDLIGLLLTAWPRAKALAKVIRDQGITLVHTNSVVSLEGALAAKIAGVPHLWHVRELFAERNPKLNSTLGTWFTARIIAAFSEQIVCISQAVAQPFLNHHWAKEKMSVVYNAVPASTNNMTETTPPLFCNGPKTLGFVGRVTPNKRLQDVIDALAILKERGEVVPELHVFGTFVDADFEENTHQRIAELELEQHIKFHGFEPDSALIYNTFNTFVCPSVNEAFGRVIIEAMAAGKICIGTNTGGVPEIITHEQTGFLVPAMNPEALAEQLRVVNNMPLDATVAMVEAARNDVNARFAMDVQMKALCGVYDTVVQRSLKHEND